MAKHLTLTSAVRDVFSQWKPRGKLGRKAARAALIEHRRQLCRASIGKQRKGDRP